MFPLFRMLICFVCAHREVNEGTTQAPIATKSTYHKHSRTACNRARTEQQSTYSSIFASIRPQSATTQASRREQVFSREPPSTCNYLVRFYCPLVLFFFGKNAYTVTTTPPTTNNLDFPPIDNQHTQQCPCRFIPEKNNSSLVTNFETDMYIAST